MGRPAALAAALAALSLAAPAHAAFPGADGRIAFARSVSAARDYDIYAMNADGSGKRPLIASRLVELEPAWSVDGKKLAFVRDVRPALGYVNFEIYVKDMVTGAVTRVTRTGALEWSPAWSPDGRLAYVSDRGPGDDYDIVVQTIGSAPVNATANGGIDDVDPAWSPDGTRIAYSSDAVGREMELFTIAPDGSERVRLTDNAVYDGQPNWSPDGERLVFVRGQNQLDVYVRTFGSGTRRLTTTRVSELAPVFSPRGGRIAYERQGERGVDPSGRVWVMHDDGSPAGARTPTTYHATSPEWRPLP